MQTVSRDKAREMIDDRSATVVETLPNESYRDYHLPTAINIPLDDSFEQSIKEAATDQQAPILVYCKDSECEASSKAAARLEQLGYTNVFDYEAGKVDWKEAGLPTV